MLIINDDIRIEDPTKLPVPIYARPFFSNNSRCLLILPEVAARPRDVVVTGPVITGALATTVFAYGGRIPSTLGAYRILWFGDAHYESGKVIQDGAWWEKWCQYRHVKTREFVPARATLEFDTESEMGMFSFHKKGVFKIALQVADKPGTFKLVVETLNDLMLDIFRSHSRGGYEGNSMKLDMTCGVSRPANSTEIEDSLWMALGNIAISIQVTGEAITMDDLVRLNERFQSLFSVFISYSHVDQEIAFRIYDFLINSGVKCWLDSHELVPGAKLHETIRKGILDYDKFLLICSASSLQSWWVDNELEEALAKERESKQTVLVPVDIDGTVFKNPPLNDKCIQIRSRVIGDFTEWVQEDKFDISTRTLFRALEPKG